MSSVTLCPETGTVSSYQRLSAPARRLLDLTLRLARRTGIARLRIEPNPQRPGKSLSEMLGKSARQVRRLLAELEAAGFLTRRSDGRMSILTPLLKVIPRAWRALFSACKMSGLMSGPEPENVRSQRGAPYYTSLPGNDNETAGSVVVSSPRVPEPSPDPETVRQAQEAVAQYAQRHPIRCWAALLRTAIAQRWKPAGPPEKVERPQRYVTAPREFVERWEEERQRLHREHEERRRQAQRGTPAPKHGPALGAGSR